MNLFKKVKVRTKLIISFLVLSLLISIVGTVGTVSLKNVSINSENMYNDNMQSVYMLTDMRQNLMMQKKQIQTINHYI